ncbi:hypothetical protein FRB91_007796 [Serendipita sp. 411]|nr:hypothetical protein FRB91_007796 [Serendipita sp. 411]
MNGSALTLAPLWTLAAVASTHTISMSTQGLEPIVVRSLVSSTSNVAIRTALFTVVKMASCSLQPTTNVSLSIEDDVPTWCSNAPLICLPKPAADSPHVGRCVLSRLGIYDG